jgi:hypothetical protein
MDKKHDWEGLGGGKVEGFIDLVHVLMGNEGFEIGNLQFGLWKAMKIEN